MSNHTHETVPTQFVEADGIRYAYRRFGKAGTVPLLFLGYFNSNMDTWDPAVTNHTCKQSLRHFAKDHTSDADRSWQQRRCGWATQRPHSRRATAECPANRVFGFESWRPVSTCKNISAARQAVPNRNACSAI